MEDKAARIATLLEIGDYTSLGSLASQLGCTEAELRESLESMKRGGYEIEENPELGVRLLRDPDILSDSIIHDGLKTSFLGRTVQCYPVLDSTNEKAKALAREGAEEGTVVIAEEQTRGRGRFGRSWYSPRGEGIWMSVILRPGPELEPVTALSLVAAHAVATALREVTGVRAEIKWPNDVQVGGRKVCGILAELDQNRTGGSLLIVGLGVNVNQASFGEELTPVATSVRMETNKVFSRLPLVRKILENLEKSYLMAIREGFREVLKDVRKLCTLVGEQVSINVGSETVRGYVRDIDDAGRLIVQTEDGRIKEILAGEASTVR